MYLCSRRSLSLSPSLYLSTNNNRCFRNPQHDLQARYRLIKKVRYHNPRERALFARMVQRCSRFNTRLSPYTHGVRPPLFPCHEVLRQIMRLHALRRSVQGG